MMRIPSKSAVILLIMVSSLPADEIAPPASLRFAPAVVSDVNEVAESPDFQRHVSPLLGRLGCNGRACHGSFQGQGGFRLSLFGYDFAADHAAIGRSVDRRRAEHSPSLQKPTLAVAHEGGRRLVENGWQYRLLRRWIAAGAAPSSRPNKLVQLEIRPANVRLSGPGEPAVLQAVARWEDGTAEDVTCLCRFESRDDSIAAVDADGRIKAMGRGDTHIVASYDNGVATVPIVIPVIDRHGTDYPTVAARTNIDRLVVAKLRELGIVPSDVCRDEDFLRRLSIDMTGTLPTPGEIAAFLADRSPDKRSRKIDELLKSPAYAAWWANRLCDMTGNNPFRQFDGRVGQQLAVQWYSWMVRRVADNTPYDQLVARIVLANSRTNGQSYQDYAKEMSSYLQDVPPSDFAERPTMPHFWTRRNIEKPADKALAVAHSFLGIRLQCAQCHKHPFDRWTKDDFQQFTQFFAGLEFGVARASTADFDRLLNTTGQPKNGKQRGQVTQEAAALAAEGQTVAWREVYFNPARATSASLKLLGENVAVPRGEDPRNAFMTWLRQKGNPYLARAFVNRTWANYFHAGLVEPVDDLNLANPPSNRPLLDYLTDGFVASGYDMRWLHREITRSDTYQRSWRPNSTNRNDRRHFSRMIPRRLPAEVVYDALKQATAADAELIRVRENLDRRAIGYLATRMAGTYAQRVFGQPERLLACDCERNNTPSLLQSIFLQNDPLMHARLTASGWLKEVATADSPDEIALIRAAYLRTVSRSPTAPEIERAGVYLSESAAVSEGLRDLLWALLNSKEFVLNH